MKSALSVIALTWYSVFKDGCEWTHEDLNLPPEFAAHLVKVLKWKQATALQRVTIGHYNKNGMTDMRIISPFSSFRLIMI